MANWKVWKVMYCEFCYKLSVFNLFKGEWLCARCIKEGKLDG